MIIIGQPETAWLLQADRLSDYQDIYVFMIENWNFILRFPNGFHNTTVYW